MRSRDTQATRRSSARAHSTSRVDLPYPAGAVTATTRQSLARALSMSGARLTEPASWLRDRQLGVEQQLIEVDNRRRRLVRVLGHGRMLVIDGGWASPAARAVLVPMTPEQGQSGLAVALRGCLVHVELARFTPSTSEGNAQPPPDIGGMRPLSHKASDATDWCHRWHTAPDEPLANARPVVLSRAIATGRSGIAG